LMDSSTSNPALANSFFTYIEMSIVYNIQKP
jgi:hypothetical protein